ncbi:hypothetical protein A9Q81_11505 [Gammaproteobacteria bacterium 42_54_T18]|nr:hypothetical protein A9Q81_11505 [Gammaproteobacteria bacterium 42_54_T18]
MDKKKEKNPFYAMLIVYLLIPWMMLTSIENRMTHDFATVPRYVEPLGAAYKNSTHSESEPNASSFPVNSPFQLRWILVVLLCLIIGFFLKPTSHKASDVIPDQEEIVEFQQEMEEAYLIGDVKDAGKGVAVKTVEVKTVDVKVSKVVAENVGDTVEYGFYDNLRNSQWAVQTQNGTYVSRELATRKKAKYKLQAASFRGEQDANRLVKKLSKYGLKARSHVSISTNGVEWYQVSVGPFNNVSKMNKAQDILVSLNMMPLKRKI